jgi:GWxTD domain-containing protein
LSDPNARVGFVESFWDSRATLPGSDGRSFREEFERRVAFADVYLAHDPETRGSLTDRGMVFVLLGPPTNARRRALRSADDPSAPSGESRVETQEVKLAMKGSGGTTSKKALIWGTFQGAEHRALSTEEEYLEVWEYGAERLPRGNPYPRVDVHYVTKKGGGKNMLQPTTSSRTTLAAAKSAAAPRSGPGR